MQLQDKFEVFGKWSCLAQCYIYAALYDASSEEERNIPGFLEVALTSSLLAAFEDKKLLDDECTVLNASALMKAVSGKDYTVTKKTITCFDDIPNDGKWRAIRKSYNGHSHWALWRGNKLIYNSLAHSVCYEKGNFDQVREIA